MKGLLQKRTDDRGFTLIELMVVVLIIGILLSIAIPSFLSAQDTANDTAAKANLRNAVTTAKVYQAGAGNGSYTGFTPAVAYGLEPSIPWAPADGDAFACPANTNCIDISVTEDGTGMTLTLLSKSGQVCTAVDTGAVTISCADPTP